MTDRYAVIGNPIAQSKSPAIHAAFARQTGQDLAYVALFCEMPDFEAMVHRFRDEGGSGLNVTVPFKHRAYALADERSERAEQALAVNTLSFTGKRIAADNTDGIGLVRDLKSNLGVELAGTRILMMGAGGAAYGVCGPLLAEHPSALVIANRTIDKAAALRERLRTIGNVSAVSYEDLRGAQFDLIVNATSAGLMEAKPPLPDGVFAAGALAYEMVYGTRTPFMRFAEAAGARAYDGLGMLVEQAAESFYIWRGMRPETAPVIAQLRQNGC